MCSLSGCNCYGSKCHFVLHFYLAGECWLEFKPARVASEQLLQVQLLLRAPLRAPLQGEHAPAQKCGPNTEHATATGCILKYDQLSAHKRSVHVSLLLQCRKRASKHTSTLTTTQKHTDIRSQNNADCSHVLSRTNKSQWNRLPPQVNHQSNRRISRTPKLCVAQQSVGRRVVGMAGPTHMCSRSCNKPLRQSSNQRKDTNRHTRDATQSLIITPSEPKTEEESLGNGRTSCAGRSGGVSQFTHPP